MFDVLETVSFKSSEERKDLYESFFFHKYFIFHWMTVNRSSVPEMILPPPPPQGLFSKVMATHSGFGNLPLHPSSLFSWHQALLSHFGIGFRIAITIISNKQAWIFCQNTYITWAAKNRLFTNLHALHIIDTRYIFIRYIYWINIKY